MSSGGGSAGLDEPERRLQRLKEEAGEWVGNPNPPQVPTI